MTETTPASTSCGHLAAPGDSIEKLAFLALRYRALIGEAIAFPFIGEECADSHVVKMVHGCLDCLEHVAADLYFAGSPAGMASALIDDIYVMKKSLARDRSLLGDRLVPSVEDLRLLYVALWSLGGRPHHWPPAFDVTVAAVSVEARESESKPPTPSIFELIGSAPERDLLVTALQALHRERVAAWNAQTSWANQNGHEALQSNAFGIDQVSTALRRIGAAASPL